ncbi:hypothetical protein ACN5L3_003130 [Cronobacter malonaticus]|uniref:hypothetical protein n=1 Tax=Cronobacter malonaticus TaxID=413503 RepID=UPI00210F18DD|nr:hypothetical protein [Cronobacter malonaticus]
MAWQVGFVIFTISDMVMHLKDIVEHILFMNDFHLNYAHVETPVEGQATAVRNFIISVLFFIGNAVMSGVVAFIFSRFLSAIRKKNEL